MSDVEEVHNILDTSADIFANSSTETVTENIPFPPLYGEPSTNNVISKCTPLIKEIVSDASNSNRICCPFCIFDFGFEYILREHIKESHPLELKIILNSKSGDISFYQCPFCDNKFFHKDILPKHVMRKHEVCVVSIFSGFSPDKYVYCRFCPHKTMRKHYKLLMIHIENKHLPLFEKYLFDKYMNILQKSNEDLKSFVNEEVSASPGMSSDMLKLNTKDGSFVESPSVKSILKPRTAYPIESVETVDDIMLKTDVSVLYANLEVKPNKGVRRKLRFELPSSPESDQEDKENFVSPPKRKKPESKMTKLKKFLKPKKKGAPVESPDAKALSHYKCGVCSDGFDENSKLLEHVKKKHRGIKLQAQFCCGDCDAKFFKNSFLLKHCKYHHSPLCLKSKFVKDQQNKF